jgi:hypothetical protein
MNPSRKISRLVNLRSWSCCSFFLCAQALCRLLRTVGASLEKKVSKSKEKTNTWPLFEKLAQLAISKKMASRLRFMVQVCLYSTCAFPFILPSFPQDIIDLRASKWVDRLAGLQATKLSEVRKEDEKKRKKEKEAEEKRKEPQRTIGTLSLHLCV